MPQPLQARMLRRRRKGIDHQGVGSSARQVHPRFRACRHYGGWLSGTGLPGPAQSIQRWRRLGFPAVVEPTTGPRHAALWFRCPTAWPHAAARFAGLARAASRHVSVKPWSRGEEQRPGAGRRDDGFRWLWGKWRDARLWRRHVPSDFLRYRATWLPGVPVQGQATNFQMVGQDLSFTHPLWTDPLNALSVSGGVRNDIIQTGASCRTPASRSPRTSGTSTWTSLLPPTGQRLDGGRRRQS